MSHETAMWKGNPTTRSLGDLCSPWLLTTYPSPEMIPQVGNPLSTLRGAPQGGQGLSDWNSPTEAAGSWSFLIFCWDDKKFWEDSISHNPSNKKLTKNELGGRYQENSSLLLRCLWHMFFHCFWRGNPQQKQTWSSCIIAGADGEIRNSCSHLERVCGGRGRCPTMLSGSKSCLFLFGCFFWGFDI